jgi:hypothetical protein
MDGVFGKDTAGRDCLLDHLDSIGVLAVGIALLEYLQGHETLRGKSTNGGLLPLGVPGRGEP